MDDKVLIVLWVTSVCNLKCKYCYAAATDNYMDMTFETAVKVIEYFKNHKMKIEFAGGEPLLNFDLITQIYDYVKEKGYEVSMQMQTNATLIDDSVAKQIAEMKIALGVSLDGSPDVNEKLRGGTNRAIQGIRCLAKAGITTNLNCVVNSQNIERLSELADVALYFGNISAIGLDLLRETGRAAENIDTVHSVTCDQLRKSLVELAERCDLIYKCSGKRIYIRSIEEAKKRLRSDICCCNNQYCFAACGRSYVVLPNGDMYPCGSMISYPQFYMGNLNDNATIKELAIPTQEAGKCDQCSYALYCSGGCPSRLFVNNNCNTETLDCTLKKVSFEIAEKAIKLKN